MDVVDLFDTLNIVDALLDAIDVKVIRDSLKDQNDTLPEGEASGPQDNDGEDIGADGINVPALRPEENNRGSDDDTDRVEDVTKDVKEGGVHIKVHTVMNNRGTRVGVVAVSMVMAVIVSVVVSVVMSVIVSVVMAVVVSMVMSVVVAGFSRTVIVASALLSAMRVAALTRVQDLDVNEVEDEGKASD